MSTYEERLEKASKKVKDDEIQQNQFEIFILAEICPDCGGPTYTQELSDFRGVCNQCRTYWSGSRHYLTHFVRWRRVQLPQHPDVNHENSSKLEK